MSDLQDLETLKEIFQTFSLKDLNNLQEIYGTIKTREEILTLEKVGDFLDTSQDYEIDKYKIFLVF